MAKLEKHNIQENIDVLAKRIQFCILQGSISASLEDSARMDGPNAHCRVMVFERYSALGKNRVSMSVTLFQDGNGPVQLAAVTSGGSQAMFFKINTFGEEAFLNKLKEAL